MADTERLVLNHYNLKTLYPSEWPGEKDDSDASNDEQPQRPKPQVLKNRKFEKSQSRFSVLEHSASFRSTKSTGSQKANGLDSVVQKDEPDPLGRTGSVVQVLRQQGFRIEEDTVRNRFLLSSTTFSPPAFLSTVHRNDTSEELLQGLDYLSRSIEQKSASLKVLVESNFERFVRAKATIDNVYTEMRNQGAEPAPPPQQERRFAPRRERGHFRGRGSSAFSPDPNMSRPTPNEKKKKNALIRESEYGVQGIKTPLIEAAVKAEEVWGPALGGQEKEEALKAALRAFERHRGIFWLGLSVQESIHRKDYNALVEHYRQARKYAEEAKSIADSAVQSKTALNESQAHQIIITARMWQDVTEQVRAFRQVVWRRLASTHWSKHTISDDKKSADYLQLISVLLELGVSDNPISFWLSNRYDYLKYRITSTSERVRVEIEVLRRRLASGRKPSPRAIALHLRSASEDGQESAERSDSPAVLEFWDHFSACMSLLLSTNDGLLGEVQELWSISQSFITGKAQRTLPTGVNDQSKQYHMLSNENIRDMQDAYVKLTALIREAVFSIFADPPVEDVSSLFTPLPQTPKSTTFSPLRDSRFSFDPKDIPPSPNVGESWESYAFWPPWGNSLSGSRYLNDIVELVARAANEVGSVDLQHNRQSGEDLKSFINTVRERAIQAVCVSWESDADSFRLMEDGMESPEKKGTTKMPVRLLAFEDVVLSNLQKILYIPDAAAKAESQDLVTAPSSKLVEIVRSQFFNSLHQALNGLVEVAEKGQHVVVQDVTRVDGTSSGLDFGNPGIRRLAILSNVQALHRDVVPSLVYQFEFSFSIKLTEETKSINNTLSQIEAKLFQAYTKPTVDKLASVVSAGINSPDWTPRATRPKDARPYVYDIILTLVLVHNEVSTTAPSLLAQVLSYHLEQISTSLISAFRLKPQYSLPALMQATLDVEFLAQTLQNYTTDKASQTQSSIYVVLDERTDNDARMSLQNELPEMRAILKRLKEGTRGEFGCFRKPRGERARDRDKDKDKDRDRDRDGGGR